MRWRRHNRTPGDSNHHATDIGDSHHYAKKSELDFPESFPEEELLYIVTDSDVQVMNKKIKLMYNKRDSILRSLEGKTVHVTALSIDIVNSSEKVEKLSSEATGEYYQAFIESTSDLIQKHGGYVLKNAGDCVIGFFLSSTYWVENYENAILCGLATFDMLRESLKPYLAERKIPAIECRISADFGPTKVLRVRSKDGYSAIDLFGGVMNSASKISHYAKPGQMVIGDALFWLIDNDRFEFKRLKRWDLIRKYRYPVYLVWRR